MLGQRHRRWTNIKAAVVQCLVFAGIFEPFPANTKHLYNICTTIVQRRSNVEVEFVQRLDQIDTLSNQTHAITILVAI